MRRNDKEEEGRGISTITTRLFRNDRGKRREEGHIITKIVRLQRARKLQRKGNMSQVMRNYEELGERKKGECE